MRRIIKIYACLFSTDESLKYRHKSDEMSSLGIFQYLLTYNSHDDIASLLVNPVYHQDIYLNRPTEPFHVTLPTLSSISVHLCTLVSEHDCISPLENHQRPVERLLAVSLAFNHLLL